VHLSSFITKWKQSAASERANKDSFLRDLCDVLGVAHPDAKTGDPARDRYVFEREAILVHGGERHSVGFIDLYKRGCFILEAKQGSDADSKKIGTARRATPAWNVAMQEAFGQALTYAATTDPPPPFLIVTDIGYCFDLYAAFDGTRNYRKFPDALNSRINLESLEREPAHLETLRTIFTDPHALDPSKRSIRVTREIAGHIASVARSLETAGHEPEAVAKFLMRCLFTMFAEDVELLPRRIFADSLRDRWIENPRHFPGEVEQLWSRMNEGGFLFGAGNIWQFNGGLFADPVALPLTKQQLVVLGLAAEMNWSDVEPAIFGTLLERALDPKERHRLGAHFTPRAYVERLVKPTIEEPLRAEWDNVRAQVVRLVAAENPEKNRKAVAEARKIVEAFYDKLTKTRVLDPACGSGNFLYVALDLFKRIENEVIEQLESLGHDRALTTFGRMVSPRQFLGIEIKPWAKEIAELVLWIGWLQWQIRTRGYRNHPDEPILRDYHNIECRDAVLAYDEKVPQLDDDGNPVTRWDGETMKKHPVTGEDVPDETARTPVYRYVNPRKAEWPEAEFIVGNPPFIGNKRMRIALTDEYVEALRSAHHDVPETADFVLHWWNQAALQLRAGHARRFGLIATNSLGQNFNRGVLERHLDDASGISLVFAIPDHPWVDSTQGAAVRISMTSCAPGEKSGQLCKVTEEEAVESDSPRVALTCRAGRIQSDLSIGANLVAAARQKLRSNAGLAFMGVTPAGDGFRIPSRELETRGYVLTELPPVVRKFVIGRDLLGSGEARFIIDFYGFHEHEARERHAPLYQWLTDLVRPQRQQNKRAAYRDRWWIFAEPRGTLRRALADLPSYIATVRVSKYKVFQSLPSTTLPDSGIIAIALHDNFYLGVLSTSIHLKWALSVSGRMGVGNDPYWNVSVAFDPFPFPDPDEFTRQRIRNLGEQLDAHRKRQQELHPDLTVTGMYNVLEKLRSGEALTAKEKKIHEQGLVSVLKQIHDDLDAAVFDAYGWPRDLSDEEILERLVALNAERAEEERRGIVRWLRPEFQNPTGATAPAQQQLDVEEAPAAATIAKPKDLPPWPKELRDQIAAIRDLFASDARTTTPAIVRPSPSPSPSPSPNPSPVFDSQGAACSSNEATTATATTPTTSATTTTNPNTARTWTTEQVARAFKGSRRTDVASVLEALSSLGILLTFDTPNGRQWRAA
jgi:hypothetical protein